jgi:hypothetical protein
MNEEIEIAVEVDRVAQELIASVVSHSDHEACRHCLGIGVVIFGLAMARVYAARFGGDETQAALIAAEQRFADVLTSAAPRRES